MAETGAVHQPGLIHTAEVTGLEKVLPGESEIQEWIPKIPPFPQPLHIVFPTETDLPYLISCLSDPSPHVRAEAAAALSTFSVSAREAIPALTSVAENDSDENVRKRAKEALYNIRGYDRGFFPAVEVEK